MKAIFPYDSDFDPAAPVVSVGLSSSGSESSQREIVALIDSGSDVTMMPLFMLTEAGCRFVEQRRLRGIVGETITVNLFLMAVHVSGNVIHGIRAVAMKDGTEAILGRDVLNQLEIVLNGPALESWIS